MQDFQPIPGLSGRIFPGSDTAARRLRNYPSSTQQQQQPQSPIKCPRCDSTNTKFCYYNNYNLSQPRHFCKSCRRYWTKGGVLRNVPVGGGCRKNSSKRSASGKSKPDKDGRCRSPKPPSAASGSSSESSSTLTASNPNPYPNLHPDPVLEQAIFNPETTAGSSFTGLMAGAGAAEGFNFSDPGPLPGFDTEKKLESGSVQQQAVDLQLQGKEGLNGLDWVGGGSAVDSGSLFDITSSVDAAAYWNQTHWGDTDPSLYLP